MILGLLAFVIFAVVVMNKGTGKAVFPVRGFRIIDLGITLSGYRSISLMNKITVQLLQTAGRLQLRICEVMPSQFVLLGATLRNTVQIVRTKKRKTDKRRKLLLFKDEEELSSNVILNVNPFITKEKPSFGSITEGLDV
ncbi:hypothetical protein L1887_14287 [Cichorium endivia]|nr:hypothetical protein L1887_14287 [Cichorium endivia]